MIVSEYKQLNLSSLLIPMQSPNLSQIGPILRKLQTKENQTKYKINNLKFNSKETGNLPFQ
jgi:hypothetical protein